MIGVAVLGSTGSIGENTLDVLARHPEKFKVVALGAHKNAAKLAQQVLSLRPAFAALADVQAARELSERLAGSGATTRILGGAEGLIELATMPEAGVVMAGIAGSAGLRSTLAAAQAGKRVLLANKESLVMAGPLLIAAVRGSGATLLPVDSEHSAIFQCLPPGSVAGKVAPGVRRVLLTASGGPFLDWSHEALAAATPEQACKHPNWVMGRKISVDSATLMNKGLELIEACLLFGLAPEQIEVIVHRQSIVHSLVEYVDGSVLAQLGSPDMRTPISHALAWPQRIACGVEFSRSGAYGAPRLLCAGPGALPEPRARPGRGAHAAALCPRYLNAANEVAVQAFLDRRLNFPDIPRVIERVLRTMPAGAIGSLEDVLAADAEARAARYASNSPSRPHCELSYEFLVVLAVVRRGGEPARHRARVRPFLGGAASGLQSAAILGGVWTAALEKERRPRSDRIRHCRDPARGLCQTSRRARRAGAGRRILARSFTRKPPWQRIVVLLAGPGFNILFAILVLWGMFWANGETEIRPLVGDVVTGSVADARRAALG